MEHVVFSAAEGGVGAEFRRVSSLEEAVRVVEHLRNDLGVMDPSVYGLIPVPLTFRTYYRVEMPVADLPAPNLPVAELPVPELPAMEEAPLGEPAIAAVSAQDDAFTFEPTADVPVPAPLAPASSIPRGRQDAGEERSLGYFAK